MKKRCCRRAYSKGKSFKELWTNSDKCVTKTSLGSHFIPLFFPCLKRFKYFYSGLNEHFMKSREFQQNLKIKSWRKPIPVPVDELLKSRARSESRNKRDVGWKHTSLSFTQVLLQNTSKKKNKLNMVVLTIRIPYRAYPPSCMFPITLRYGDVLTCGISWLLVSNLQQSYTYDISHFLYIPIIRRKM